MNIFLTEDYNPTDYKVLGYFKPEAAFHTISEWENISREFIDLESKGYDVRGGIIDDNPNLVKLINDYFSFQLYVETERYDKFTKKMVLDFIEDFVNHRVWNLKDEFKKYLYSDITGENFINEAKISFFYSRGNLEPYILLDNQFTKNIYGSTDITTEAYHWTSQQGLKNIIDALQSGYTFPLSCFTTQFKEFFRPESNYLIKIKGKLIAAFQSDVKSFSTDKGNKAANLYRFSFPEHQDNLCTNWDECQKNDTYLWNEIIIRPTGVLEYKKIIKY